jgi:hypothetical protein
MASYPSTRDAGSTTEIEDAVARAVAVAGLGAVAAIHLSQVVPTAEQTPWLGAAFIGLILAATALAVRMSVRKDRAQWLLLVLLNTAAIGGFVFTRLFSTSIDPVDVGNWSEGLGMVSLFVEGALVALSFQVLARQPRSSTRVLAQRGRVDREFSRLVARSHDPAAVVRADRPGRSARLPG